MGSRRSRSSPDKFLTGEEVRAWRLSRNLTQPDVGRWLGLTQQAIARYEVVGATKATAMAFAAIDRCLQPVKVTRADLRVARLHKPREDKNEDSEEA